MSSAGNKTRVVFTVTNCICHDQRVRKIAETVTGMGCHVTIVGRNKGECCNSVPVPFNTKRFRMLFRKGFAFYMFFNIRLFFYLLFNKHDILVSNDLDTLLPGFLVTKMKKLPLVYDSHEYFTGVPELQHRPVVKCIWKSIEAFIFPRLKNIMTVSDEIAMQYKIDYGIRPVTIRNCTPDQGAIVPYSREELGVEKEQLLIILQGTGINIDRGGEELIEAVSRLSGVTLFIVGSGDAIESMKKKASARVLSGQIRFIDTVPGDRLARFTKTADAGVSLDKDTSLNHRFSLPNKIFDYLNAGIAIIGSDLPEIRKIISEYNCGIIIDEVTPEKIAAAIKELINNRTRLEFLRKNAFLAGRILNWETESVKVKAFYKPLFEKKNTKL